MTYKNNYKILIIIIIVLTIILACDVFISIQSQSSSIIKKHGEIITTTIAKSLMDITELKAIGLIKANQGIEISADTGGTVTHIDFISGQYIQKGKTIACLMNKHLIAKYNQDKSKYTLALRFYKRYEALFNNKVISSSDLDRYQCQLQQAKAILDEDRALINKTIIKAPFSGKLGISRIDVGQYVSAGQSIVSLQDTSALFLDFAIPMRLLNPYIKSGIQLYLNTMNGEKNQYQAEVIAVNSIIDTKTRSLELRAKIMNPDDKLIPGMYVEITLLIPANGNQISIPQVCINYGPKGSYVYVIKNHIAELRYIQIVKHINHDVIITKGLSVGDEVAMAGQLKLHDGSTVQIINTNQMLSTING